MLTRRHSGCGAPCHSGRTPGRLRWKWPPGSPTPFRAAAERTARSLRCRRRCGRAVSPRCLYGPSEAPPREPSRQRAPPRRRHRPPSRRTAAPVCVSPVLNHLHRSSVLCCRTSSRPKREASSRDFRSTFVLTRGVDASIHALRPPDSETVTVTVTLRGRSARAAPRSLSFLSHAQVVVQLLLRVPVSTTTGTHAARPTTTAV